MKKIASLVGAGALLFSMVAPSFAFFDFLSDDISIRNYGRVSNDIEVEAETGDNEISGFKVFGGRIRTGDAFAVADVSNLVNTTSLDCGCLDGDLTVRNYGRVYNDVDVEAETGDNEIHGFWVFGGSINTGGAEAAGLVTNIVNTTTTGGGLE
ncbi:MAG: hypothetical protein UX13_C0015G0006 [Candidatus Woesebacteria bacterium GW2011_GWB1_45_5]|uniref:Uncharacterized protein n=1 Tax=Candidatus Woesebacteria bacterium GW2011_GWB1_45_5 TaxID=1618581 RepID=A0A0G1MQA8_9BACT|nr:MAG: hypothetical protein UX13_C0015G0006 [Candidatus Woesebacteria bacterium GW2011_GWB1_45_5]